jgi:small subunit ribosomal protein S24e
MEIEIQTKTNNPLLKRTEVHFTVHHEGEKTPKRDLIRSELADKLNVKKENIMIHAMQSSFGSTDTVGYAKVYTSVKVALSNEKKHVLRRNNALAGEKKQAAKGEKKPAETADEPPAKPSEEPAEKSEEEKSSETPDEKEKPLEEKSIDDGKQPPKVEKPAEEKKE